MGTLKMEEMSWTEIEEKLNSGYDTVIIPIASIEQHGPHLPLNTDTLLGEVIAQYTAEKLGNAMVAPAIRPGLSEAHMDFAGSLTISEELLNGIICEYCKSYKRHGFKVIVLLPSHGQNFEAVQRIGERLKKEYERQGIKIVLLTDLSRLVGLSCEALMPYGFEPNQVGWHAGAAETTAIMALRPELVKEEKFVKGYTGDERKLVELIKNSFKDASENGILGDPRGSKAEMGKKLLEYIADDYAKLVKEA